MERSVRLFPLWLLVLSAGLVLCGCGADDSDDEGTEYYLLMSASHATLSVAGLWEAMGDGEDYNGTYILLRGDLYDVDVEDEGGGDVTLINSSDQTVDCEFDSDIDISGLQEALDLIVIIGGICHYETGDTDITSDDYPYLESCDYSYVYEDQ